MYFLKFNAHFLQGIVSEIKILLLTMNLVPKNQNEPKMTAIHLFSHVF